MSLEQDRGSLSTALKVGTKVLVYGDIGEIQKVEHLGNGRHRYNILFEQGTRAQTYTSPPTTIEPIRGPIEQAVSGKLAPEIEFDLLSEALRLSTVYEYDRMVSLSSSRINLEPYQIFAVHQVLNAFPHRYLIADDTGLGKTIETGMILEELAARGRAERVFVVAPASICSQWKDELKKAFSRDYVIYDGPYLRQLMEKLPPEQNPWEREPRIITSLDLAKRDEFRAELERTTWDVVIFDEAHKLSARRYGSRVEETLRYKLAKTLAERTDSLFLLSATPHNGDRYAFHALLRLVDEYAFPSPESLNTGNIARVTIRRTKKEILDEKGRPVFVQREVGTRPVTFSPQEEELYRAVTDYVAKGYNLAKEQQNRAVGFLMVLFQKRMVSSIEAIKRSLKRRWQALEAQKAERHEAIVAELSREELKTLEDYLEDPDSLSEAEREHLERRLEVLPAFERLDQEIAEVKRLYEMAEVVTVDSKAAELLSFLEGLLQDPQEKVIIFTEYRDTLDYLGKLVEEHGWKYAVIHGGMAMPARRESQRRFEEADTRILLATDAAGEGLNLHWSCHLMINYELPWNPNRIEQRIGRLHRYGQKRDVKVYNLFVTNTREDQILQRLLERLEQIETDLPGDLYNVLGSLLQDVDLKELIMQALAENQPPEVTAEQAAKAAEERAKMLQHVEQDLLMDVRRYDHESALKLFRDVRKASATTADLKRFAEAFLLAHGAKIKPTGKPNIFKLTNVPPAVQREGVHSSYERVTFDKDVAKRTRPEEVDFIAFGHPLFDAIIDHCKSYEYDGVATVKFIPNNRWAGNQGILFNFLLRFTDGSNKTVQEEFHPIFLDETGQALPEAIGAIPKLQNLSLEPSNIPPEMRGLSARLEEFYERALKLARKAASELENQVQEERLRLVHLMRDDLERYSVIKETRLRERLAETRERINEIQEQLDSLTDEEERRRREGTLRLRQYDLQQAERELAELQQRVKRRQEELGNMEIVVDEEPKLLNLALVKFVAPKNEEGR